MNTCATAWYTASNAAAILSGTSMASPHVAGVAALVLVTTASTLSITHVAGTNMTYDSTQNVATQLILARP